MHGHARWWQGKPRETCRAHAGAIRYCMRQQALYERTHGHEITEDQDPLRHAPASTLEAHSRP